MLLELRLVIRDVRMDPLVEVSAMDMEGMIITVPQGPAILLAAIVQDTAKNLSRTSQAENPLQTQMPKKK